MHSTCFPVFPIKELVFLILLAKNSFGPGLLDVMLFWMEFNNLLLKHLTRVGFKRHLSVEPSKKHSMSVCACVCVRMCVCVCVCVPVCAFVCKTVSPSSGSPK